jgi:hypothetical protein
MADLKPQAGCYYFPNYHLDRRNQELHGPGWSEWELVKRSTPRFSGHRQPLVPAWGYTDEADPAVMAQKIDAAADHGIDFFIFDWYYYDDGPFLERGLDEGFLKAPNNDRIKFCCMWANHDWLDIHPCGRVNRDKLLYHGRVTPDTFKKISRLFVERYFSHSSYFTINGAPYFSIYDLTSFMNNFGSVDATRKAMDDFRALVKAAGFPDLHLNAVVWGQPVLPGEKIPENLPKLIRELGFDSITSYVWVHHVQLSKSPYTLFIGAMEEYFMHWDKMCREYDIPYFPNVTMGWDSSPRTIQSEKWEPVGYPYSNMISDNTPENFRFALEETRQRLARLDIPQILNINCWNEWTEGSYLEPDSVHGMSYLEAVKSVFSSDSGDIVGHK